MPDDSPSRLRTFEVVLICTGNRARSPFAVELLRRQAQNLPVGVRSFGTLDLGPAPALPEALFAAHAFGVDLTRHRARSVSARDLVGADLAIGFEPFHVASAVVTGGVASERAFLLTELAELLEEIHSSGHASSLSGPEHLVELAHAARLTKFPAADPIADPVGRSQKDFLATFERIDQLVTTIAVRLLRGARWDRVTIPSSPDP